MQAKQEMEAIKALSEKVAGIVETVTNDNGTAIKYADGTMIQYGSKSFTGSTSENAGSYAVVTFPQAFADNKIAVSYTPLYVSNIPVDLCLFVILTGSIRYGVGTRLTGDTVYRRLTYTNNAAELSELYATDLPFNWQAIGRWK